MRAMLLIALGALALISACVGLASAGWILPADHFSSNVTVHTSGWFPLINLRHNAFLHWRLDSALIAVFGLLPAHELSSGLTIAALLILFAGLSLLFLRVSKHRSPAAAVFCCFAACLVLLRTFGWDHVLFQSFAWVPFFILCVIACLHGREAFGLFFVLSLFFALRIAASANQLAPLAVIIGLAAAAFLFHGMSKHDHEALDSARAEIRSRPRFLGILGLVATCSLSIAAMPVFDAPSPNGQNYPWQSHVVSEDWISGNVHPLLGPGPVVPFIDREMLKGYAGPLSLALLLVSVFLRLQVFSRASILMRYCSNAAIIGFLLAALDTNLREAFAYISPLATLMRIVPGSFLFPLAEVCLLLSFVSLALACCLERKLRLFTLLCLVLITVSHKFLMSKLPRTQHDFSTTFGAETEKFVISPSFPVINALGMWVLPERERVQRTQFLPSASVPIKVSASHSKPGNEASNMFDQDRQTRWSAGRAFQQGDEWLYLKFETAQTLSAIELAPALFKSDYPAALRISSPSNCPDTIASPTEFSGMNKLVEYKPWQGSLDYTSENYPFYSAQKRVRAFFPQVGTFSCLFIEQIGTDSRLDWSIAEIRLGVESSAPAENESLDVLN